MNDCKSHQVNIYKTFVNQHKSYDDRQHFYWYYLGTTNKNRSSRNNIRYYLLQSTMMSGTIGYIYGLLLC